MSSWLRSTGVKNIYLMLGQRTHIDLPSTHHFITISSSSTPVVCMPPYQINFIIIHLCSFSCCYSETFPLCVYCSVITWPWNIKLLSWHAMVIQYLWHTLVYKFAHMKDGTWAEKFLLCRWLLAPFSYILRDILSLIQKYSDWVGKVVTKIHNWLRVYVWVREICFISSCL